MVIKSIINHKGGVGKTTTTLNLGKALSIEGYKVLIVDIDPQANLSQSVGIEDPEQSIYHTFCEDKPLPIVRLSETLDIVPSDLDLTVAESKLQALQVKGYLALKNALAAVKNEYDYVLIDCPPSLGILTNNALLASTDVMIVLQSQYLPTKGMDTIMAAVESAKGLNSTLNVSGILITQIDHTVMSKSIIDAVRDTYNGLVYQSMIRRNISVVEASSLKQDIFSYDSKCAAAEDYKSLTKEMLGKLVYHG
ncbi:chromosome partitioning protein [Catalinimonas alkaloidigena]|uniref:ParA family protein n=1 Tax=Catalinimonas alkaloidigena TaxID=1075417 RepID=UPI002404E7CB|nr:ParA family protein [Catalinimonas alkaloidigena]MDF9801256.1 chromosome partitioning protein [Catalinimonas alkaloidigena]